VTAFLEVWNPEGRRLVPLGTDRLTIGAAVGNDVHITQDRTVSRMHASLERYLAGWCVRDLSSRNGTYVNGERIWGEQPLRHDDEIRVGSTRLLFRAGAPSSPGPATQALEEPPALTSRERDVLVALCRPLLSADVFTEPASIRTIAAALCVSDAAVKQHLSNLYDKFAILGEGVGERRRVRLANEALRRGAVTVSDLRVGDG
jgi:predicted component of type VI protein secretion system